MTLARTAKDPGYLDALVSSVYPTNGTGITATTGANEATPGTWVEILPAATVAVPFAVVGLMLAPSTTTVNYVVELGAGAGGSEVVVARNGCRSTSSAGPHPPHLFAKPAKVAANARLAVRVRSGNAGASVTRIFLLYYPLA